MRFIDEIETNGLNAMFNVLSDFGGWPLIDENYNPNSPNYIPVIDKLVRYRKTGNSPIVDLYISADPLKPDRSVLRVNKTI